MHSHLSKAFVFYVFCINKSIAFPTSENTKFEVDAFCISNSNRLQIYHSASISIVLLTDLLMFLRHCLMQLRLISNLLCS